MGFRGASERAAGFIAACLFWLFIIGTLVGVAVALTH